MMIFSVLGQLVNKIIET